MPGMSLPAIPPGESVDADLDPEDAFGHPAVPSADRVDEPWAEARGDGDEDDIDV